MEEILKQILEELKEIKSEQSQIKTAALKTNESVKRLEIIQDTQQAIIELQSIRSRTGSSNKKRGTLHLN